MLVPILRPIKVVNFTNAANAVNLYSVTGNIGVVAGSLSYPYDLYCSISNIVSSTSTSTPSLQTGTGYHGGTWIRITNSNTVIGANGASGSGGAGGTGGGGSGRTSYSGYFTGGGGGGAGGYLISSGGNLDSSLSYTVTVGAGASVELAKKVSLGVSIDRQYGQSRVNQFNGNIVTAGIKVGF